MEPSNNTSRRRRATRRNPRFALEDLSEDDPYSGWSAGRAPPPLPIPPPLVPSLTPLHSSATEGPSGSHPHHGQALSSASPPPQPCSGVPSRRDARVRRGRLGETERTRVHIRQSHLYSARPKRLRGPLESTVVVSGSGLVTLEALPDVTSDRVRSNELSRFKLLSVDDVPPACDSFDEYDADNNTEQNIGEGAVVVRQYSSDDDSDEDGDIGNPFVTDRSGNLTTWRLSDLETAFVKHLEDETSKPKPKEKKYSKEERLKLENDCKKQYMKSALQKYNYEESLAGDMCFEFEEIRGECLIVEGGLNFYQHFNFEAKQAGSKVLFFAEVIPDEGDTCDVLCCKPLDDHNNGHCFGCKNLGFADLRHPACESMYAGGHVDCQFPFMVDSSSEDECD